MIGEKRYKASNNASLINIFSGRTEYSELNLENSFDFWGRNYFLGRISDNGNTVFLSEGFLKPIKDDMYVQNFVADAYLDWKPYFDLLMLKKSRGKLLKELSLSRGWVSVHSLYQTYLTNKMSAFHKKLQTHEFKRKVKDFRKFMEEFISYHESDIRRPFLRSTFITSKYCNPFVSGLLIDLKGDRQDSDFKKSKFIQDNDYKLYVRSLAKFGFRVNENAPWVIVADINSKPMKEYMARVTNDMYKDQFYVAFESDIDVLKTYMLTYYNAYVYSSRQSPLEQSILKPEDASNISDREWFIWLTRIKLAETSYLG